jgi:hypothetical protein
MLRLMHRDGELVGLERKLSDSETLKVTRDENGFSSDVLENPLEVRTRTASATIQSSLFQAAADAELSDRVAFDLAEIFQYDIDFVLDIQSGDHFTVVYEEVFRTACAASAIFCAAKFINDEREYRAVRYIVPKDTVDAARRMAKSKPSSRRRAVLANQLSIQSFGASIGAEPVPRTPGRTRPVGASVRGPAKAVKFVGHQGGFGNVIELEHGSGVITVYGHLSRFAAKLHRGQRVEMAQVIGYVGMTGLATGPHLHYEYRVRGVHKNPQTVPLPTPNPFQRGTGALPDRHGDPREHAGFAGRPRTGSALTPTFTLLGPEL